MITMRPSASGPSESFVWLVAPGLAMIAVTYGLARFAYGLFLPQLREDFALSPAALGLIGAGSYVGYCVAVTVSLMFTARAGPRGMVTAAGLVAVAGMALVAVAPTGGVLALGVLIAGSSAGLASPPMGDAVASSFPGSRQNRANTLINSGTSLGIALSGPAAIVLAEQWRVAWACFAVIGLAVLVWNRRVMPIQAPGPRVQPLGCSYFHGRGSIRLFTVAASVGLASAVYWIFARDLVVRSGGLSEAGSTLFWTVIGVCGLVGGLAGDLVRRVGLVTALRLCLIVWAAAIALLGAAPDVLALSYLSAVLFGSMYIMITGIILIWSVTVFVDRPSAGLGAGFLLIAAGQAAGSPIAGSLADATSLSTAFLAFAAVPVVTALVRPPA